MSPLTWTSKQKGPDTMCAVAVASYELSTLADNSYGREIDKQAHFCRIYFHILIGNSGENEHETRGVVCFLRDQGV